MPELPEIEYYRRLAERVLHRTVGQVVAPDDWYLKQGLTARQVRAALRGQTFTAARRRGKLLMLDTATGPTLGLRFGMTGRLLVDGRAGLDHLEYGSSRAVGAWDRFVLRFDDGGDLRIRDPRRLGGVLLDPVEDLLGPDALTVSPAELRRALDGSVTPLKARLMDQTRVAGLGNLLVDEVLWRAGLDPAREAGSLSPVEQRRLHRHVVGTVADLMERGGSHSGDVHAERRPGGVCPRDGEPLVRRTIGGRTTWSCPRHQR